MGKSQYSYTDWWNGNVYLSSCGSVSNPDEVLPPQVNIEEFDKKSQNLIKSKQRELFEQMLTDIVEKYKQEISLRYNNSKYKNTFLEQKLNELQDIITFKQKFKPLNLLNEYDNLRWASDYYKQKFVEGNPIQEPDFMNSPNFKFAQPVPFQVRAHSWDLLRDWLLELYDHLINAKLEKPEQKGGLNKRKIKPHAFGDLFKDEFKSQVSDFMDKLCNVRDLQEDLLVTKTESGGYYWNANGNMGNKKLMAGLIAVLQEEKIIDNYYSSTELLHALTTTFNCHIGGPAPFKTNGLNNVNEKYKMPFRDIVKNSFKK